VDDEPRVRFSGIVRARSYLVARSRAKRAVDVALGLAGGILAAPIIIAACAAVAIESGFPVFFTQPRAGLNGEPFRIWKIRTMVRDAADRKADLLHLNESPWPAFKLSDDPRVLRVGSFLRRSSIDELPQIWNVIRGEMSLVGPRPLPVDESDRLDSNGRRRLGARPGITGMWQVSNRHARDDDFDQWLKQDMDYIENWSLTLDFQLMWRTIGPVLRLTGK
jgi:lipopolysaccharide/colanic/teichoic acid biosynthesis glycosyltransferase